MEVEKKSSPDCKEEQLKRLGFVRIVAVHLIVFVSYLYQLAKQNSGSLRSKVITVEGTVNGVVGPVYEKFKGVPDDLLRFLDKQVDEAVIQFNKHAPVVAKHIAIKAQYVMQSASQKAGELVQQVKAGGPRAGVYYVTKESKQIALTQSVLVWVALNQYPPVRKVASAAVPVAEIAAVKYNHVVNDMAHKGYTIFGYLPLVPVEDIAKEFKKAEADKKQEAHDAKDHKEDSSSDSD